MPDKPWEVRRNRFKLKLKAGETALAMVVSIPWPGLIEILGSQDIDGVFIDLEHTTLELETVERMIMAAELAGVTPCVRALHSDAAEITRLLDAGAMGITFPHIETAEDAITARRSLHYPPNGDRGWGGSHTRYAGWQGGTVLEGSLPESRGVYSAEFVAKAESDVLSSFVIESKRGVANIDEILDVGCPDVVSFGRGDFSLEVGFDADEGNRAAKRVREACQARGIGMSLPTKALSSQFYAGCYGLIGIDSLIFSSAMARQIENARVATARS
jgi:2-keto-3-deoxy-L-rhamnonate aldolase RhmA